MAADDNGAAGVSVQVLALEAGTFAIVFVTDPSPESEHRGFWMEVDREYLEELYRTTGDALASNPPLTTAEAAAGLLEAERAGRRRLN